MFNMDISISEYSYNEYKENHLCQLTDNIKIFVPKTVLQKLLSRE